MSLDESKAVIRKQIQSVEFGFYTDEDVRKRSVVEITNPITFDNLENPLQGGLCDPRLGPSNFKEGACPTCSLREMDCPGHFGHIELAVPVHHPLLVQEILNILKCKCLACHKLRAPPAKLAEMKAKFNLLNQGQVKRVLQFGEEIEAAMNKGYMGDSKTGSSKQTTVESARRLDNFLATLQPTEAQYANWKKRNLSAFEQEIQRELVKECFSLCKAAKFCGHCSAGSPTIRQDSGNKFFQKELSNTMKKRNMANGVRIESALKGDGDDRNSSADVSHRESGATEDMDVDSDDEDRPKSKDHFMHASEVQAQLKRAWKSDPFLMNCLYGPGTSFDVDGCRHFFLQAIPVPPNRFRPIMETNGAKVQHSQNQYLTQIMDANRKIRDFFSTDQEPRAYSEWIKLQTNVNCFMDSSLDPSATPEHLRAPGIRQLLERKEGLFRKNMMGKRVNYACRSVISPDPYVGANEIGLPLYFASTLTYPTPVTHLNEKEMRQLVERGSEYPGARWAEVDGRRMDLTKMKKDARASVAKLLLSQLKSGGKPSVIGRQLVDGDYVLMNRQPTLHKPGIMAHRVRVLHNPTQKTIRMHYSNCDTYNADFDGDEMNCHFPQSDLARAEAKYIARTDLQYIVPTDGSPLRGLIQDHVVGGVKLTKQDTFLEKWEYQQLLFACLASLPGLEVIRSDAAIELLPPALIKPRELWTGKQVITTVLRHLQKGSDRDSTKASDFPGISVEKKAKTPGVTFGKKNEEHLVIIRDGELLRGVLDKAAFGATDFSLVHAIHDAYGPEKAGIFLNALSRLFTAYVQYFAGHSCRTEDLILTKAADEKRRNLVQRAYNLGTRAAKAWADSEGGKVPIPPISDSDSSEPLKPFELAEASAKIGELLSGREGPDNFAALDGYMQGQLNPLASDIVKASLPDGLVVQFPYNSFGIMTTTGAKGSIVNQSQVICSLGQQALEGRRVPRLSSGRTLPSFAPYDPRPRADGFVMDRFLTGVRPQEYYFHCMAGREGLVDTAVKTSRSGYLQRCLVKHLEELKICYDFTVRNAEGGVVQFLYGEDGLDPTKAPYLDCTAKSLEYLARNHDSVIRQNTGLPDSGLDMAAADASSHKALAENAHNTTTLLKAGLRVKARRLREGHKWERGAFCHGWFDAIVTKVSDKGRSVDIQYMKDLVLVKNVPVECNLGWCGGSVTEAASSIATLVKPAAFDPLTCTVDRGHRLGSSGACISERVAGHAYEEMMSNKRLQQIMKSKDVTPEQLGKLIASKYSSSLCAPGEAVGSIAAQSIGEPSTQMTLNTFHLAGAGANVTLGIPRLREIIMTASRELKTPTMSVPLRPRIGDEEAMKLTRSFKRVTLMELIAGHRGIRVIERLGRVETGEWKRLYHVRIKLHPAERIRAAFGVSLEAVAQVVSKHLAPALSRIMQMELKKSATKEEAGIISVEGGQSSEFIEEKKFDDENDTSPDGMVNPTSTMDELGDNDDEDDLDQDEMGEEDGVRRNRSQSISYDDDGDSEAGRDAFADDLSQPSEEDAKPEKQDKDNDIESNEWNDNHLVTWDKKNNFIDMIPLKLDPAARPLLMVQLVERAAEKTVVLCRDKIDEAYINDEDGRGKCLQTAGINFEEIWKLDETEVDHDGLLSNDIWQIRTSYGVEAARNTIVQQITSVFGVYGIQVDPRHLSLIADYMTYEGDYKPMSRNGMKQNSSAFLQMSFETTANFLKQAAMIHDKDVMTSPSANIVVGRPIKHGSGLLEVLAA